MSVPTAGDEVRLFVWNGVDAHDTYRSLVRNVDALGGSGGGPRLDLSYWDGISETNLNNVRNEEAFPDDLDGNHYWKATHAKQVREQSYPPESWNRADTDEGRVCWVYVFSLDSYRKCIITNQRNVPGNRIDGFYINTAAGTRVTINNVKAMEDTDESENYWYRRRLSRGNV